MPIRPLVDSAVSSEPGKSAAARSLAIDGEGNLYVEDEGTNRIEEFSPGGRLPAWWSGPKANSLGETSAMTMDPRGNVYVSTGVSIMKTCISSLSCS
jgi:streptogramin lyase